MNAFSVIVALPDVMLMEHSPATSAPISRTRQPKNLCLGSKLDKHEESRLSPYYTQYKQQAKREQRKRDKRERELFTAVVIIQSPPSTILLPLCCP